MVLHNYHIFIIKHRQLRLRKKNPYVLQGLYIALSKRQLSLYIYLHATVDENKAISEQIQRADCTGRLNTEKRYRNVGQHTEMVLELKEKKRRISRIRTE